MMAMRLYVLALCVMYFGLWGYFSLFYENDTMATAARMTAGCLVLAAVFTTVFTASEGRK